MYLKGPVGLGWCNFLDGHQKEPKFGSYKTSKL